MLSSIPDEALEVRQQLLDESPYLSDTVMKLAIYKEDVLPNAMIRDVLVANPQSAKSDEVLDALDNRWDPMPDYMVQEIMAGEDSLGNKELMESRIRSYRHLRNLAYNELAGIYLHDTVNEWAPDSLVALLQNEPELYAKYNLAFQYFKESDTVQVNSVLNEIPSTFILSDAQQQTHQNYLDYIGILQALQNDTINGHYPDSLQLVTLYAMADSCIDMPSVYARNLLIHLGLLTSGEMVYMPVTLNSTVNNLWPFKENSIPKSSFISLFPNPAGNYLIVEYHIDKAYETAVLTLQDMTGKLINTIPLKGQLNQTVVSTGGLNNGVYIVSLYVDSQIIDSQKMTVLK
ncbi:MAG: T9SS type A sorting domain-containing protein [Bacteroidetes bacterium]|nr:T9SS type A sorting domain-containing protein [Bacteroidota bacterium]